MYLVSTTPTNCLLNFYETLHSCSTQPADVHEGILLLSKILKFEHHSIASGGYHSVRSLTVLVIVITCFFIFMFFRRGVATIHTNMVCKEDR